jgi:pimeloyl-ACP methyl ester carboxylesterase
LTILFFIISIGWWILLLVSIFISPPLMNSRGSGFYEFAYASVAVAILLVTLLFFTTPSRAEQYSCFTISILLLVDTIIILAVERVRSEEGWVGLVTIVWAMFMTGWCVLCDRVVEYGKAEEEERLTGRHETKRSLREWTAVFTSTLITMALIAVTAFLSLTLIMRAHDASLIPPGKRYFVDSSKYAVHLFCEGNKNTSSVTVLLEAGEKPTEAGMEGWVRDAYNEGSISRYCYWDRPGYGFSDNAPSPLSAGMAVDALSEALAHADEDGPYILVSHGIGGIYSRIFAGRHTVQIRGLLLIDNVHERDLEKIASPTRGFRLWLRGVISPIGPDRLWGWMFKGHSREDRIYGKAAYQNGKVIKAKLQENLVATTYTRNEINTAKVLLPKDVPLVVVSSGKMIKHDSHWYDAQSDLSNLTDKLVGWDIVDNAPHEVWAKLDGKKVLTDRLHQLVKGATRDN